MTDIEFSSLDPLNSEDVDAWHEVLTRSEAADLPGFPVENKTVAIVSLVRPDKTWDRRRVLAKLDGRAAAIGVVHLSQKENLHLAEVELNVAPQFRRRGVGTALLGELERQVRADNRNTIHAYVSSQIDGGVERPGFGTGFAERNGYVNGQDEIHRRVDLNAVDEAEIDELLARAWVKADGYELVQWIQTAPEDLVDQVAYLDGRLLQDAPIGDLDLEPQKIDAERVRQRELDSQAAGQLKLNTGVRHIASGRLAGWSDITVNPGDESDAWQGITIVDPQDRGHRIGTILKAENQRLLRRYRPMMRYVHTWNAEENKFMININESVGYRAVDRWTAYQKKLG